MSSFLPPQHLVKLQCLLVQPQSYAQYRHRITSALWPIIPQLHTVINESLAVESRALENMLSVPYLEKVLSKRVANQDIDIISPLETVQNRQLIK